MHGNFSRQKTLIEDDDDDDDESMTDRTLGITDFGPCLFTFVSTQLSAAQQHNKRFGV